jgi:hypothetical protein
MLRSTPEYVQAHISGLQTSGGTGEVARHRMEAVARHRRDRRERFGRLAASLHRSLPFVNKKAELEAVPVEVPGTA